MCKANNMTNIEHILIELTNIGDNIIQVDGVVNNINNNINMYQGAIDNIVNNANILQGFIDQMNLIYAPPDQFIDNLVAGEPIESPVIRDVEEEERRRDDAALTIQWFWWKYRGERWHNTGHVSPRDQPCPIPPLGSPHLLGLTVDENFDRAGWGLCSEFHEAGGD